MPRITIDQKVQLRTWYFAQPSKPSEAEAIKWFKRKFNETLPQYQISRILHSVTLSSINPQNIHGLHHTRIVSAQWPIVEEILYRWQIVMELWATNTSRESLMEKALHI
ncbi:hypothetical protein GGS21DRAFT_487948 [Xylaria nigripes]|nr:hypothetical protein GGS21DRAFT_487948 [Xylaria nigripes]